MNPTDEAVPVGPPPAAASSASAGGQPSAVSRMQVAALQRVFEHLSEGLILANAAGEVVHWNRAALAMHGLVGPDGQLRPLDDLKDAYQLETLDGRVLAVSEWPMVRTLRGEEVKNVALRMRRLDQPFVRIFWYGGTLIRDESGEAQVAVLHITDVTERHEAELMLSRERLQLGLARESLGRVSESLRERDELLALVFDQLPVVIWTTNPDLRITSMRGAALRGTALDPERMSGRLLTEFELPDQAASIERHRAALAGQTIYYDVVREGRTLRGMVAPLRSASGAIAGTLGMTMDITVQAQAEVTLREAAYTMAQAQRLGHFGSWELAFDEQGRPGDRMLWSDELYRIYGLEPETGGMPRDRARAMVHPDDAGRADSNQQQLAGWRSEWNDIARIVRPDGEVRNIRVHARMFLDERTQLPRKMIGTVQDVTEQQAAEEEIRRLNQDLERRVAERTAELGAANAELESFAYAVAHDLRAPLRAMAGFARALMEDYRDVLQGDASEYIDEIIGASRTMGNLIDAMLSLSRHTRGGLQRGPVDVTAMACHILRSLERAEAERSITWIVDPNMNAWGDMRMVDVVLHNLLSNAWKYTSRTASPRIEVTGKTLDGMLHVRVADNGAGFSMDHAAKLFQPFQRLHRQDEFPGIGIGLATVQRIIRRHGGTVTAHGKLGEGAVFEFSLPLAPAVAAAG